MNRNCAFGIILILCLSLLNPISVENHRRSHISLGFDESELGSGSSSLQSYIPNEVGVYPGEVFRYHNQTTVVASNLTHVMLIDVVAERIIATHECAGWTITHGSIAFVLSDNRSQVLCSGRILEITTNLNGILSFFQLKTGSFHQTYRINNGEWLESNCSPQNTVVLTFHLNNSLVKTIDYSNCGSVYSGDPLIVNGTEEFGLVSAVGAFYPVLYDTDLPFGVGDAMSGRCPTFTNAESHRNHFSSSSWNFGIFASETSDLRNCVVYIGDDNSWISFVADPSSIVNDASAWRDDCFIASTTTATYLNGTKVAGSSQTSDCLDSNRYLYKSGSSLIVIDVDSDNDGVIDIKDSFPFDATQNLDSDNDGYGDSANGSQPDGCVLGFGNSSEDVFGCPDTDGDGYSDNGDAFPRENSQWNDSDNDGFGDNQNGFRHDACPNVFGSSVRNDTYGCHDADFDGWADFQDHFPNESSQWKDSDGDGYGDEFNGFEGDDCILTTGKSYIDRFGCSDGDGDGVSDKNDAFPNNPSQTDDRDSDGYGDNQSENATQIDRFPDDATQDTDSDGDGYGDNAVGNRGDRFPNDPNEWEDTDGDDVGNNEDAFPFDPSQTTDADGDGFGDNPRGTGADKFPQDATQWSDIDGDGYGDNAEGTTPDAFIADPTQWSDVDGDGYGDNPTGRLADAFPSDPTQWEDMDGDGFGDNLSGNNPDPYLFDFDNDGYNDSIDPLPKLASPGDLDNDGVLDENDAFPEDYREWADADGDGEGDNADTDDDNDGWTDTDEVRQGTDPFSSSDQPIDGFEVIIPGTQVSLGAWDLIGIFGGVPVFIWIAIGFATRNGRTARYEEMLRGAQSVEDLEHISGMWEYSLMMRMLGPHQGIRLERLRADLEYEFLGHRRTSTLVDEYDQTEHVEKSLPGLEQAAVHEPMAMEQAVQPGATNTLPTADTTAQRSDENGYEWFTTDEGTNFYRTVGSGAEWVKFEN